MVLIMVRPGYWGARELALLPRKKDERDAGAQQFPWKRIRWREKSVRRNPEVGENCGSSNPTPMEKGPRDVGFFMVTQDC